MSSRRKWEAAILLIALIAIAGVRALDPGTDGETPTRLAALDDGDSGAGETGRLPGARGPTLAGEDRPPPPREPEPLPAAGAPAARSPGVAKPQKYVLSGTVTVGGQAATGGTLRLRGAHGTALGGEASAKAEFLIGSDGSFRIPGLESSAVVLWVSVDGMQPRVVSVKSEENQRIEIARGSGSIWGVAYDALGRPAQGAQIRLATQGLAIQVFTSTDLDGIYEFRDLPADLFVLVGVVAPETPSDARNMRSYRAPLKAGERKRVDIGAPEEDALWTGGVRYADGVPRELAGNVFLTHEDGEGAMYVQFDAAGKFSERVRAGTYYLRFVLPALRRGPPGFPSGGFRIVNTDQVLVLGPQGLVKDLVFPGGRVSGTVRGLEPKAAQTLSFRQVTADVKDAVTVDMAGDGSYQVDGLAPGLYLVTGLPRALGAEEDGSIAFDVFPDRAHTELDLVVAETR